MACPHLTQVAGGAVETPTLHSTGEGFVEERLWRGQLIPPA